MPEGVLLGFDFGFKRIGVAVGSFLTGRANPLSTVAAQAGIPHWPAIDEHIRKWKPQALVVGIPTCVDDSELYTTPAAKGFATALKKRYQLPVHRVDERMTTVEARAQLFSEGGYRKLKRTEIDSIAACLILEQWLQMPE